MGGPPLQGWGRDSLRRLRLCTSAKPIAPPTLKRWATRRARPNSPSPAAPSRRGDPDLYDPASAATASTRFRRSFSASSAPSHRDVPGASSYLSWYPPCVRADANDKFLRSHTEPTKLPASCLRACVPACLSGLPHHRHWPAKRPRVPLKIHRQTPELDRLRKRQHFCTKPQLLHDPDSLR
jgi:hypothetical protein